MNKVILMGRLTRDPDVRYSSGENQLAIARFSVACDRRVKKDAEQTADFISCVAFGKTAEFIEKFIKQGSRVCLDGRIQTGSYTNKEGQKVYTTDVVVDNIEFAESKIEREQREGSASPRAQRESAPLPSNDDFMHIDSGLEDEGLPFN